MQKLSSQVTSPTHTNEINKMKLENKQARSYIKTIIAGGAIM